MQGAGGAPGHREDLRGQQREDDAVLVGGPHRAVAAQERGARALLAAEADRGVDQARHEPLEAHRHLEQLPAEVCHDAVDEARGDHRLAHLRARRPVRAVPEQVGDGRGQVVVGVHQAAVRGDDPVAVRIRVVAGGDVVLVALLQQRRHRPRARAVHADLPVAVQGHEGPLRVDRGVDDGEVEVVHLADLGPVVHRRAAQRIRADAHARPADRLDVDHAREVLHVGAQVVVAGGVLQGLLPSVPAHALEPVAQQLVRAVGDPRGRLGVRGAAVGRVVLEAAVARRVVARGDDDAVGPTGIVRRPAPVVDQDRVRDRRGGGVAVERVDLGRHVVAREDLERRVEGGAREGVGVPADEQRAADALRRPVLGDRLRGRGDVVLVERDVQRGAAVPGGAEGDRLVGIRGIRVEVVVGVEERVDVDEVLLLCLLACTGVHDHHSILGSWG